MFSRSSKFVIEGGEFYNVDGDYHETTNVYYAYDILRSISVPNAAYYAGERRVAGAPRCTPGTRTSVIDIVMSWATNPFTRERILWLNGLAGEGKSAIAQSVAEKCARHPHSRLAASFFFSRAHAERSSSMRIFPTIAYQLTNYDSRLKQAILQALQHDTSIPDRSPEDQLKMLIINPIMSLMEPAGDCPRRIIMIEALDECDDYMTILECLVSSLKLFPHLFRLVITSRPERQIQEYFSGFITPGRAKSLSLSQFDARADIRLYLEASFNIIRRRNRGRPGAIPASGAWPSSDDIRRLVDKSAGLFIYASSIISFVDHWYESPGERLSNLLDNDRMMLPSNDDSPYAPLDRLYTHILSAVQEYPAALRKVLGSVMSLLIPLSRQDLLMLLSSRIPPAQIAAILDRLYSVLKLPSLPWDLGSKPIQIYHQSFRDFLTNEHRSGKKFSMNPSSEHSSMARCCFELMRHMLKRNICGLHSFARNAEIQDLPLRRRQQLPGALRYAYRFWAHHLCMSSYRQAKTATYLLEFLQKSLLYWVECMSLLGELGRVLQSFRMFSSIKELEEHLRECETFVLIFYHEIATSSQAVYNVALQSCPLSSPIRKWYRHELAPFDETEVPMSWAHLLRKTVKEHRSKHRVIVDRRFLAPRTQPYRMLQEGQKRASQYSADRPGGLQTDPITYHQLPVNQTPKRKHVGVDPKIQEDGRKSVTQDADSKHKVRLLSDSTIYTNPQAFTPDSSLIYRPFTS
ncbi:vegetative incompatibility protein het-e-1 [Moniliophthora roreri]|uniref:NACHT domain-containing protein n=1 Tax=Moniliophthora roreri TaxID=221103 RepID=A0A0W0GD63_MONRR|nr:vegetative incompatibility protein het-e-1 [Moniliophthora roreri]